MVGEGKIGYFGWDKIGYFGVRNDKIGYFAAVGCFA